jgi:hypothetical protein
MEIGDRDQVWEPTGIKEVMGTFGVEVWKATKFGSGWETFSKFVEYEVGDGSNVSFWHDVWCEDVPSKIYYSDLSSIACNKDARVADNMQVQEGNTHWNVIFTRPVQDWEVGVVFSFFEMYSFRVKQGDIDRICWSPSKRSKFEVKSYYQMLIGTNRSSFPWKSIWWVKAPLRVAFFVKLAALEKILTLDNLRKMNVMVVE